MIQLICNCLFSSINAHCLLHITMVLIQFTVTLLMHTLYVKLKYRTLIIN